MNAASREECARLEDLGLDVVGFEAIVRGACQRRKACCWNLRTYSMPTLFFHRQQLGFGPVFRGTDTISEIRRWFGDDVNFAC